MKMKFISAVLILFTALGLPAQTKLTEGKVTYSITLPEAKKGEDNMIANAMGKEQVIYFKGKQSRVESKTQMGDVVILSGENGITYTLLKVMGKKIAMKTDEGDLDMLKEFVGTDMDKFKNPVVTITKETKRLAGYKCTKALITYPDVKGEKMEGEVWFSNDISFSGPREFKVKGIEGFPMEFTYGAQGKQMKMICTKVEPVAVKEDMFRVPEDYTITTMMEMMNGAMEMH